MRKTLMLVFGFVAGCVATASVAAVVYYQSNFVELNGPAGAVARQYLADASEVMDLSVNAPKSTQDIAAQKVRQAIAWSVLAAHSYCAMNDSNRASVRKVALGIRQGYSHGEYAAEVERHDVASALDYLARPVTQGGKCTAYH